MVKRMVSQQIKTTIEQIRQEELQRYSKSLKVHESIIVEKVTQGFIEKLIQKLEENLFQNEAHEKVEALAMLFSVRSR
jgi:glutamyl-tRNA reductase